MKTHKFYNIIFSIVMSTLLFSSLASCSEGCSNEDPRARITNNGTDKASVQIKTSNGNTENINGIEKGQSSVWASYAAGNIEFTVAIQGVPDDQVIKVDMVNCWEYNIVIDAQNKITSTPQQRE